MLLELLGCLVLGGGIKTMPSVLSGAYFGWLYLRIWQVKGEAGLKCALVESSINGSITERFAVPPDDPGCRSACLAGRSRYSECIQLPDPMSCRLTEGIRATSSALRPSSRRLRTQRLTESCASSARRSDA